MNWAIEESKKDGVSIRPLHWSFHKTLALAVVEANLKHAPDVVTETGSLTNSQTFLSFFLALTPVAFCKKWYDVEWNNENDQRVYFELKDWPVKWLVVVAQLEDRLLWAPESPSRWIFLTRFERTLVRRILKSDLKHYLHLFKTPFL